MMSPILVDSTPPQVRSASGVTLKRRGTLPLPGQQLCRGVRQVVGDLGFGVGLLDVDERVVKRGGGAPARVKGMNKAISMR